MIKAHVQKFLGITGLQSSLVDVLNSMRESIVEACYSVLTAREPYLACVTFMADTVDDDIGRGVAKATRTGFGAETFILPGETKTILVPIQRLVGHCFFFVSGHPNIVITEVLVANDHQMSNTDGLKFGRFDKAVRPGDELRVTLAFRTASP